MKIKLLIISCLLLLSACKGGTSRRSDERNVEQPFSALPFPAVQLPAIIDNQQEAVSYMTENYWNSYLDPSRSFPSDSLLSSGILKTDIEQKFADWTAIVSMADLSTVEKAIGKIYDKALECKLKNPDSNVFETLSNLFIKYYYNPNSPLRNEEIYLYFVRKYADYPGHSDELKEKYRREAVLCSLNRIGEKATDFRFSDNRGRFYRLHDIESEYTLLFFSNPGCEACMDIINVLRGNQIISDMIASKRLSVVNVYIDEDIQDWLSYMPVYPKEWYNGFDPDYVLRGNTLYNIRAIPSLYLLDKDKRVIFKDSPENVIFNYLHQIGSM